MAGPGPFWASWSSLSLAAKPLAARLQTGWDPRCALPSTGTRLAWPTGKDRRGKPTGLEGCRLPRRALVRPPPSNCAQRDHRYIRGVPRGISERTGRLTRRVAFSGGAIRSDEAFSEGFDMGADVDGRGLDAHPGQLSEASSVEQLASSHVERSTITERVACWLSRRGITSWVRTHRRAARGGAAAVLVVITAGVGFVASRPPPVAPFHLIVTSDGDLGLFSLGETDLVWADYYAVSGLAAGDTDRVVGIVGPGLSSPTGPADVITTPSQGIDVRLGATLSCPASKWSLATDMNYRARVQRTDAFGRLTEADVSLSNAGAWHRLVVRQCLLRLVEFDVLTARWGASVRPGSSVVDVSVDIRNPEENPIWLSSESNGPGVQSLPSPPTLLVPEAWTRWTTDLAVRDCRSAPRLDQFTLVDQNGMTASHVGLPVSVALTGNALPADKQYAWLIADDAADGLTQSLTRVCVERSPRHG
jgi:hypothetical protein